MRGNYPGFSRSTKHSLLARPLGHALVRRRREVLKSQAGLAVCIAQLIVGRQHCNIFTRSPFNLRHLIPFGGGNNNDQSHQNKCEGAAQLDESIGDTLSSGSELVVHAMETTGNTFVQLLCSHISDAIRSVAVQGDEYESSCCPPVWRS